MAERYNRTVLDQILPSLLHSNLPVNFWEDAAHHALTSINLSPTRANEGKLSPESLWTNKSPSYKRLRAFGCRAYQLVTGPAEKSKLGSKTSNCLHLYTLPDGDGYMVWDLILNRAVKTHDVVHHEDCFPGVGEISKKTPDNWMRWSTMTSTSLPDHSIFTTDDCPIPFITRRIILVNHLTRLFHHEMKKRYQTFLMM